MRSCTGHSLACLLVLSALLVLGLSLTAVFFFRAKPRAPQSSQPNFFKDNVIEEARSAETKSRPHPDFELVKPVRLWPPNSNDSTNSHQSNPEELRILNAGHYRGMKAELWDPYPSYEFRAFGKNFRLDLRPSPPVTRPGFKVLHVYENTSEPQEPKHNSGCFYTGTVAGDPNSQISVSLCHGMRGHIWTSQGGYTIEPAEEWRGHDDNILHRISLLPEIHHHEEHNFEEHLLHLDDEMAEMHRRRKKRSSHSSSTEFQGYTIELLIVVDRKMKEFHGDDLEHYIINLISAVDKILKDPSIGNPLSVALVRVMVMKTDLDWSGVSLSNMLNSFCRYQQQVNEKDDSHPEHHDAAIFLTRDNLCGDPTCPKIGFAEVGGICRDNSFSSCSVVKETGLSTVFTIAHELGHLLSLPHDNSSRCERFGKEDNLLMAGVLNRQTHPWTWSKCSRHLLTEFLEDGHGYCLLDASPVSQTGSGANLGEEFDLDRQCQLIYGMGFRRCPRHIPCEELWCLNSTRGTCFTPHLPWADGTPCDVDKWCQKRKCVFREDLHPINGGWSKWQRFGECSRTCGGGVRLSIRECNNPTPANGGKYCLGERVRYHSCNIQDCPFGSKDFRAEQCAAFNYQTFNITGIDKNIIWFPKYDGISLADRCKLYCRAGNSNDTQPYPLKDKVIDGTTCDSNTFDICVNGICQPAGCDHVLHSNKQLDYCGECGGDNSTCKLITGTYNTTNYGYTSVVTIPAGSNFVVKQHGYLNSNQDNNYLALLDIDASAYILNGQFHVSSGRKVWNYAGIFLEYSGSDAVVEKIRSFRPLKKDLNIQVGAFGSLFPPDITYEFTVPYNTLYKYTWGFTDKWTPCNKLCNGVTEQEYRCIRADDLIWQDFPPELCEGTIRGEPERRACNTDCTLEWQASKKSECSSDCGPGYRLISFECVVDKNGVRSSAQPTDCAHIPRPHETEPCEGQCIEPKWTFLPWGECSKSCGTGIRTRKAYCMDTYKQKRNDSECLLSEKKTEEPCNTQECPTWHVGEWTECTKPCDGGKRHRAFWCLYDGKKVINEKCPLPSPVITETCNDEPCAYWIKGDWSKCSVMCGHGEETRNVFCSIPNACSNDTKPMTHRPCYMNECSLGHANAIPGDINKYTWKTKWSECSVTCGKGEKRSSVECYDNNADKVTDSRNCVGLYPPPHNKIELCYKSPCPRWVVSEWEPCSAICGSGSQSKRISCESHDGTILPDHECPFNSKPPREEKRCNVACPNARSPVGDEWMVHTWSPCSVSCGTGIKVRKVVCNGHHCSQDQMPQMSMPCVAKPCEDKGFWNIGDWGQCSATCGEGVQERQIRCESREGVILRENFCSSPIPRRRQQCKLEPCKPVYKWEVTRWTPCTASCGKGIKHRRVECKSTNGEIVSPSHCLAQRKRPNHLKICKKAQCPFDWEEGEWSQCSSSCGHGSQTRKVRCVKNYSHGKIRKDLYEVDERFCNTKVKPETKKACKGYCNNGYKWGTGEWQACNKPCSRRGKQRRHLNCYYGKKKVPLKYCPKELRPVKRRKCDQIMCPSCRALQEGFNERKDGEYELWLQGRNVSIYCYNMQENDPKEYISLPSDNYAEIFSKSIRHPSSQCSSWNRYSDYCENDPGRATYGFTFFKKIHVNISSLIVDTTDWTFATTLKGSPVSFGEAGDCHTRGLCPEGKFIINLTKTGFRVSPITVWVGLGEQHAPPNIEFIQNGQKVVGKCGGCCGFCKPRNGLKLDLLPP